MREGPSGESLGRSGRGRAPSIVYENVSDYDDNDDYDDDDDMDDGGTFEVPALVHDVRSSSPEYAQIDRTKKKKVREHVCL